jgi:hypothetical protein
MPRKLTNRAQLKHAPTPSYTDSGEKIGRPELELDEDQIRQLAAIQCSMTEIAAIVKCARTGRHPSVSTLERRFAEVIEKGRHEGKMSLKRTQFTVAMGYEALDQAGKPTGIYRVKPDTTMLIWLGKVVLGQRETSLTQMTGPDGGPLQHQHSANLNDDQMAEKVAGIISMAEERAKRAERSA